MSPEILFLGKNKQGSGQIHGRLPLFCDLLEFLSVCYFMKGSLELNTSR